MRKIMKKSKVTISVLLMLLLTCSIFTYGCTSSSNTESTDTKESTKSVEKSDDDKVSDTEKFTDWNQDSAVLKELTDYVDSVTDESSSDFIPVEDRIAVFDFDGTLFCETFPIYFEWQMYAERVLNDDDYEATEEMKSVGEEILEAGKTGVISDELEKEHANFAAQAYAGMTVDEYSDYVRNFLDTPAEGFDGLQRKDAFYLPMKEVVNYLQDHDFTVYIVTGSDRLAVRTAIEDVLDIPERQIIGMDVNLVASGQGDTDGLDYVFQESDKVVRGDELLIKNVKMNKVSLIAQEIGTQPVLAFGNSSGDISMAEYVTVDNPYHSEAFLLVNDDTKREHGNAEKAQSMRETFEEYGWNVISMKDDFANIYPEGVKVTP